MEMALPAWLSRVVTCPLQGCHADELSIAQGEELEVIEDGDMEEWVKVGSPIQLIPMLGAWSRIAWMVMWFLSLPGSEQGRAGRLCP